jgi:hypothetical protein
VIATDDRFENFIDDDDGWFSDIELKVLDLEKELSEWRESRTRELTGPARHRGRGPGATGSERDHGRTSAGRTRPRPALLPEEEPHRAADRTQVLIDRGRRTARPPRARPDRGRRTRGGRPTGGGRRTARARPAGRPPGSRRGRKIAIGSAAGLVALVIGAMIVLRHGPSWPSSVATVQDEITAACQNPNIVSEPSQVDFACGKDTSQILWVFALLTSGDNPGYADAKTKRKGLEPITPTQGGEIAWSLNLHHPYNPASPVDSLQVAARAINNIIGGATLTGASGNPVVQPGLESKPENCARYTGSSAIVSRAGFPSLCASPVTSPQGQAALVADVYQQWMPGATPVAAQDVSVLFENAHDPGNPQVQAILKTLPEPAG